MSLTTDVEIQVFLLELVMLKEALMIAGGESFLSDHPVFTLAAPQCGGGEAVIICG